MSDLARPHGSGVTWQLVDVVSPRIAHPVPVVAAKDIPYVAGGNRFQTLSLYLPKTSETLALLGSEVASLPKASSGARPPHYLVHIHGGAWRDPQLTSASIEPAVAHAFSDVDETAPIIAVASINYTISQFPTHPTSPYDAVKDHHSDPAREATHPQHLKDVLSAFVLLREYGLTDASFILSGHSCGACLAFQATLQSPDQQGLPDLPDAPCPAAILGLNGLYDLPALVHGLGASHEHLRGEYDQLLSYAFGSDQRKWPAASPTRFDPVGIANRVQEGKAPRLVVVDQSHEDQLVPMNQKERLEATLGEVSGLQTVAGHRCTGKHATPWEQGSMLWESVQDVAAMAQR